jgi:hypothetical protein
MEERKGYEAKETKGMKGVKTPIVLVLVLDFS